ncbi:hypothetical protein GIB67_011861 [Kingdonia uniflora]|uniref:Uncharacterized protein n=1 Tax=Kingdonia uniflora TaxID=39325 RepID=A0A7J7LKW6_9MAGN|nr:hypothetical protein GIB67_011861 [Kingdonia uniflora]
MAATARTLLLSRFDDLSFKPSSSPPQQTLLLSCPQFTSITHRSSLHHNPNKHSYRPINCLISGVDGGGVADDFVSTHKHGFSDQEFSVIANMLKQIEPLDTSVISKGVSSAAKDSMKRTISTMLGILPSDQFSVTIKVSRKPLDRLLASSIITGYTLWNAEYRVSLTRNFEMSPGSMEESIASGASQVSESECEEEEGGDGCGGLLGEGGVPQSLMDLTPEALHYMQELKSELATIEKVRNFDLFNLYLLCFYSNPICLIWGKI